MGARSEVSEVLNFRRPLPANDSQALRGLKIPVQRLICEYSLSGKTS